MLGGVGIALADDDLYISDVLFITSAVLMFLTSVAFAITIKVFVSHHPGTSKGDMQLTELTDQSQSLGADSEVENVINSIERLAQKLEETGLHPINKSAFLVLVADSLFFCGACYTIMWAFRKRNRYLLEQSTIELADYSLVNGLFSVLTPLLLIGAFYLFSGVLEYMTKGEIKMTGIIPFLMKGVRLREYNKQQYWELENTFYYRINVKRTSHPLWEIDTSGSSCLLWMVILLSLQLCFTYFFDETIVEYKYSPLCVQGYDCFLEDRSTHPLSDIECTNISHTVRDVHCFRFVELSHIQDSIGTLSKTFAFYLFLQSLFRGIFTVAKFLLALKRCRLWGILFVIVGSGTCIVTIVVAAVWKDIMVLVDVVGYIQILYGGIFCLVIGLLVLKGKWRGDVGIPQSHNFNKNQLKRSDSTSSDNNIISDRQSNSVRKRASATHNKNVGSTVV